MKDLYVARYSFLPSGVYGTMFDTNRLPFAVTLENVETVIDPGVYHCTRDHYNAGGYDTFLINVPKHDRVLLHKLNFARQSKACIGIAESFELVFDKDTGKLEEGVANSEHGFNEFWKKYAAETEILLHIREIEWQFP